MRKYLALITLFFLSIGEAKSQSQISINTQFPNFNIYSSSSIINANGVDIEGGVFINKFNHAENTKGRRFFFDTWAKGAVHTVNGVVAVDSISYNIDKLSGSLLASSDRKTIISVNKTDVSSFNLTDEGKEYIFEKVDLIKPQTFFQVISKKDNGSYVLYKSLDCKFIKADYHTDGLMESGNQYDEYKDAFAYFLVSSADNKFQKIDFKKKSIMQAFSNNERVVAYFKNHNTDPIDEDFVKGLVEELNR